MPALAEWIGVNEAKLRKLIAIFEESGVEEMEYSETFWRGVRLRLSRSPSPAPALYQAPPTAADFRATAAQPGSPGLESAPESPASAQADTADADAGLHTVSSPMVGTFFSSPSPEDEAFVSEGEKVAIGRTLCIIEAMKIMNEIEADVAGVVTEILVGDGEPVEYNQPLLKLRPD